MNPQPKGVIANQKGNSRNLIFATDSGSTLKSFNI